MRFFSAGDMFGMLLVMFAVPSVGPFPTVIVLVAAIVLQSNGSLLSNMWYNLADVYHHRTLFSDVPQMTTKKTARKIYWALFARRIRKSDKHVFPAQKTNGETIHLTLSREKMRSFQDDGNDIQYVRSAHPGFAYILAAYVFLFLASLPFLLV